MIIKTQGNAYVNMESFSGFTIGYPNESDFTVLAMKELIDGQVTQVELARYSSEKEAMEALDKMIEHTDSIREAEYFGYKNDFQYVPAVFKMPEPTKNIQTDIKYLVIDGKGYSVPLKVINEIHKQDMIDYGKNIAENRELVLEMKIIDPDWEPDDEFYYTLASMVENRVDSIPAEDETIMLLKTDCLKKKEIREQNEKEAWLINYLFTKSSTEELNTFMGEPADIPALYTEDDVRDVIKQMPHDAFESFYNKCKSKQINA